MLGQALKSGALKLENLGAGDLNLLGVSGPDKRQISSIKAKTSGPSVPGFLGNLLGERGLAGATLHFVPGLFEAGKSIVQDVTGSGSGKLGAAIGAFGGPVGAAVGGELGASLEKGAGKTKFAEKIAKPIGQQYAWQYGPLFKGNLHEAGKRFYEAPLGPILDVATLASLGAGGAGRVGSALERGSMHLPLGGKMTVPRMPNLGAALRAPTRTTGRPGLELNAIDTENLGQMRGRANAEVQGNLAEITPAQPVIERPPYSRSPLRKGIQILTDKLVESKLGEAKPFGVDTSMKERMATHYQHRTLQQALGKAELQGEYAAGVQLQALSDMLGKLSPAEKDAYWLLGNGIVNRRMLQHYIENDIKPSLAGTPEYGASYKEHGAPRAYVQRYEEMLNDHGLLRELDSPSQDVLNALQETARISNEQAARLEVSPEEHLKRQYAPAQHILGMEDPLDVQAHYRHMGYPEPVYLPHREARGFTYEPRRFGISGEPILKAESKYKQAQELMADEESRRFRDPRQLYLEMSDLQLFRSGAARADSMGIVNAFARMEEDLVENGFGTRIIEPRTLKDTNGESIIVHNQREADMVSGKNKGEWIYFPVGDATKWFKGEINLLRQVAKKLEELDGKGIRVTDEEWDTQLNKLIEDQAKEFTFEYVGASRADGVILPRSFMERMRAHTKAYEGFGGKVGQIWINSLNIWRTATLAWMPRWWINTAGGSAVLALLHGTWDPRLYAGAIRLMGTKRVPGEIALSTYAIEHHGPGIHSLDFAGPTRGIYKNVQRLENVFRTSAFLRALDRDTRKAMRESAESIDALAGMSPKQRFTRFWDDEYLNNLLGLGDKEAMSLEAIDHAVSETDRFFYNFLQLGPNERRFVRQIIPFYGWYKFVTKFIWRLPVDYPGRANIIARLGYVGQQAEEEMGPMPDWMKGSIFFNKDPHNLKFMTTYGLNPFSQFANPYGPQGAQSLVNFGQFAPAIQAMFAGMGVGPFGETTAISPQEGITTDFLGRQIRAGSGEEVRAGQGPWFKRVLGAGIRSLPQMREMEQSGINVDLPGPLPRLWGTGGRPTYPESLPLIAPRPMAVREETRKGTGVFGPRGLLLQSTGTQIRERNLAKDQSMQRKSGKFGKTKVKRQLRKLRKDLAK